jgi:hypothetical protein
MELKLILALIAITLGIITIILAIVDYKRDFVWTEEFNFIALLLGILSILSIVTAALYLFDKDYLVGSIWIYNTCMFTYSFYKALELNN